MKLSKFSVEHPAIIGMVLIALAVFGIFSIATTNMEFMGDISMPQLFVITVYPGASAEDIEESVIDVMEENFVTLPDFKSMTSTASNSVGSVVITFADDVDPYSKVNDVRNRVNDLMPSLPQGIDTPQVVIGGASMLPIMSFAVEGGDDIAQVSKYVEEELKPQLTQISGVSEIQISGLAEPRINIKLQTEKLDSKGISPLTVYQILSYSNISLPLGTTEYQGHDISVRFDGKYNTIDDIKTLPVGATEEGKIIKLEDVAEITLNYIDRNYTLSYNDNDVLLVDVFKRTDGNTIDITNQVKKVLAKVEKDTGDAIKFSTISDDSKLVVNSMKTVIESGLMGVLIAVVIIYLFLNDRKATLAIAISIPLSIFFTFIGMKLAGITINLLSISGIVVSLGSIVDASIVVIDQVYRYYQEKRDGRYLGVTESIIRGSEIVGASVLGSNLTTVIVFVPFLTISGLIGAILYDVSMTFMISILASLIVALVFMPWLLKAILKEGNDRVSAKDSFLVKGVDRLEKGYERSLGYVLKYPGFIIMIAIGILALTLYTIPQIQAAFIPSTDNNDFYANIEFPYGYNLEETQKGIDKAEAIMRNTIPEEYIDTYVMYAGKSTDAMAFANQTNVGGMHIVLVPVAERDISIHDVIRELQYNLEKELPAAKVKVYNGGFDRLVGFISGGGGYGLKLIGNNEEDLYKAAVKIQEFLQTDPEVISTSIDANYDNTNAIIKMSTDYLSSLGLTAYESGMTTAILFNGMDVGTYRDANGERYDIHLASDIQDYPVNESTLSMLKLTTQAGSKVSFPSVSELDIENTLSQINHSDRARAITVSAQLTTESPNAVASRVDEFIANNPLPAGVSTATGGLMELLADSLLPIALALIIAVFLVYMVMVIIFERFRQPLLVMLTVPFCLIGVMLSLVLFNSTMNMLSILGIVSLAGMLVNNGIIMVDYINYLRDSERRNLAEEAGVDTQFMTDAELVGVFDYGYERDLLYKSTKTGTASRLRPILMSSLTTILGVIPMAIASGEGSEVYAPLGQVIMGGLTTSMVITLFVMPVFYYVSEKSRLRKTYKKNNKLENNI
ncbi:MAG: efflux RND transporter permease subunit [Spirochaetales bacterium]|nr:efflux RND transporter permease subunit [Spirochaetales bacterium]